MKTKEFSIAQLALVYVALIVLALSTWGLSHVRLGERWVNDVVALTIAVIKAALVVAVFMELSKGRRLTKVWAGAGLVWLVVLFSILGDYLTRGWDTVPGGWTPGEKGSVAGSPGAGGTTPTIYNGRTEPPTR